MNLHDNQPAFDGKPPKSAAEIRSRLQSIHDASDPHPVGSYGKGLPTQHVVRPVFRPARQETPNREYYRRLLVSKSTIAGALSGGLIGANVGFALPILLESIGLIPLSILLGAFVGAGLGIGMARAFVVRRRMDLFVPSLRRLDAAGDQ